MATRRSAKRRRAVRRRRAVALLVLAAAAVLGVLASAGGGAPPRVSATTRTTTTTTTRTTSASRTTTTTTSRTPDPGSLPQTTARPAAMSGALAASLWAGVVHDSTRLALPAFFPERAYVQLKSIGDPQADWSGRLVHDFTLDLGAAHALLGAGAARARLVSVDVVASYAHWIDAGVCDNRLGYWEMPNARVVYREGGVLRSFGIASLISWRGVWYVVHFGAILRATDAGAVDAAASGRGVSAYSGTC
jgi:hypothetical protein